MNSALARSLLSVAGLIAALLAAPSRPLAAERTLWRIGSFDRSSNEFKDHRGFDYSPAGGDPVFRVGASRDADWLRFQPGAANAWTSSRPHPYTIVFSLPEAPRGVYRLKVAILYETPRRSSLRLEVNGHAGRFFFHPELDYGAGDWEGTFVPNTSVDTKTIDLPAEWLRAGENRLVLTAIDEPDGAESSIGSIPPGHSGLVYDALELRHDAEVRYDFERLEAQVRPTIFFRQSAGGLAEVVEVYATFGKLPPAGAVVLELGKARREGTFSAEEQFGERRFEFEVPEWNGAADARVSLGAAGSLRALAPQRVLPAKRWTVFIVPNEHLDVGFTDYAAKVAELHAESLDAALEAMREHPEFRWTPDGFWVLEQYWSGRSPARQRAVLEALRRGRILLPFQYASQHTGTASLEGLARSFYDAHAFAKAHGLSPARAAHIVDVPSYSWSYASVLHEAGVKYFLAASNNWRAPAVLQGRWNEKSPFYWEGPDGSRVLMWYSRAYLQLQTLFGAPWRMSAVRDALPVFLQAWSREGSAARTAIIFGSQLENTAFEKEQATIVREFGKQYAWPRLRFAGVEEAMAQLEREAGGKLPVFRGDFGPYWEDGFGSDALGTAMHRGNQARILTAEKLSGLAGLLDPNLRPDRGLLASAWKNSLLYDEHTWTFVGASTQPEHEQAVTQIDLKRSRAVEARRQIEESVHRGSAQLGAHLSPKENALAVFNALSWERGGLVETDLPDGLVIVDPATGRPVPVETRWIGQGRSLPGFGAGYRRVRFLAEAVPALGYRLYPLRPGEPTPPAAESRETTLEGRFYRLALDPASGAVKSLFDKELGLELVDPKSPYRFGAYLYVDGGDDIPQNSLYRYGVAQSLPKLAVHPAANGRLVSVKRTPFGQVAVLESSGRNTPLVRTELTLFDAQKRLEVRYAIRKERVLSKEAVYFAFPFASPRPSFAYASQNGWIDPARDTLPGGNREWFAVSQWAAVRDERFTATVVPLDAPLMTFGDVVRGAWPEEFRPSSATLFSWPMNNYWNTNFQAWQGGEHTFRFAITSARTFEPAALTRFGWEAMTVLETGSAGPRPKPTALPADSASLLRVEGATVAVTTLKLAEDGEGTILRLQELAGTPSRVRLGSPYLTLQEAWRCSLLEERQARLPLAAGGLELGLKPFEVATVRVRSAPKPVAAPRLRVSE